MTQNIRVATWVPEEAVNTNEVIIATGRSLPGNRADTTLAPPNASTGGPALTGANLAINAIAPTTPVANDIWIDISNPAQPVLKAFNGTSWQQGTDLPQATAVGQVLISGLAPGFNWQAGNIDGSRY